MLREDLLDYIVEDCANCELPHIDCVCDEEE